MPNDQKPEPDLFSKRKLSIPNQPQQPSSSGVRVKVDAETGEYHLWDGDQLALTLTWEEACEVSRNLPRMSRSAAVTAAADALAQYDFISGETRRILLLINDLANLVE